MIFKDRLPDSAFHHFKVFLNDSGNVIRVTDVQRHSLTHADARQRSALCKGTFPNVRHRLTHADAHQRCAVCKGTGPNVRHRLTHADVC